MPRRLTAAIALVLALAVSGCGKDDASDTTAKSVATATQAADAATAGNESGSKKSSGSKTSSGSTSSGSKSSSGSQKTSASKRSSASRKANSSGSKTSSGKKAAGTKKPAASDGGSSSNPAPGATGGDSSDPRLALVAVIRRYQKDFIDKDVEDACTLLTAAGKKQMITGGRGRTCAESIRRILDQAKRSDIKLIEETRAGIHVDDVTIRGDDATVRIATGERLRLVRLGGRWLVDDPSP